MKTAATLTASPLAIAQVKRFRTEGWDLTFHPANRFGSLVTACKGDEEVSIKADGTVTARRSVEWDEDSFADERYEDAQDRLADRREERGW